jgi:hypothetical protein
MIEIKIKSIYGLKRLPNTNTYASSLFYAKRAKVN